MKLDPFYPIVDTLEWVEFLVDHGVKTLQLRAKDLEADAALELVSEALLRVANDDVQLIINDYWQAAIECGADYIHLGQGDLEGADIKAIKNAGIKLGISTHDEAELEAALKHDPDYIALGPVYHTTLKQMPFAPQGLDRVTEWKKLVSCPLVAIGGITLERADEVWQAGADSLSLVSDVMFVDDPEVRINTWLEWAKTKRHIH